MISPRTRRLTSDYEQLRAKYDGHPSVRIDPIGTVPPERYRVTYTIPSLRLDDKNRPLVVQETVVDLELPSDYPRSKPRAVAHGSVFHPNFGEYVCIADFWSPSQGLTDIVAEIGQMLQWQLYNVQSPLNAVAADWAVKNKEELPIGNVDMLSAGSHFELNIKELPEENS